MSDDITAPGMRHESRLCDAHGRYEARVTAYDVMDGHPFEVASRCPACDAAERERKQARATREHQWEAEKLRRQSGVPLRFQRATCDNYHATTPRMRTVRALLANFVDRWDAVVEDGQSLLLVGGPGTGKTHLACAAANALADRLIASTYGTGADLAASIRQHYGKRGGEADVAQAIAHLQSVPLLVVDEVNVGVSDHDVGLLFRVMDSRYANAKPMIVISNRPMEQLETSLGQPLMDRLRECAVTAQFDWPSRRGHASRPQAA